MFNIELNPKLYEYALISDNDIVKYVGLTHYEARQKNNAYRLNRVNKCFRLSSEVRKSDSGSILILPRV